MRYLFAFKTRVGEANSVLFRTVETRSLAIETIY